MSYAPNPEALRSAFAAERFTSEDTTIEFALAEAGLLSVSGGKIAAGDPQSEEPLPPFTQCVPQGEYPVTLAMAGERLAYARVLIDPAAVVANWYPALTAEQDARTLQPGETFGFEVASGSACFRTQDGTVAFSDGVRNGRYPSYFGYDSAGRVAALVTDFGVIPGIHYQAPPRRSWWQRLLSFWK
ncbi:DUF4241 domain-containing protein [Pseudoduganella sp. OTU4001]|uniref:DUF4241 domain-containing protein n=1 Tax=Pseudoduganella sp. OTU4001 TaxID=3043854 RepID=UPI00313D9E0A